MRRRLGAGSECPAQQPSRILGTGSSLLNPAPAARPFDAPAGHRPATCNALLVYPRFNPHSFWNYQATCEVVGAKHPAGPLGLITVAALLPASWTLRLVDRNIEELDDTDLDWADLVL